MVINSSKICDICKGRWITNILKTKTFKIHGIPVEKIVCQTCYSNQEFTRIRGYHFNPQPPCILNATEIEKQLCALKMCTSLVFNNS